MRGSACGVPCPSRTRALGPCASAGRPRARRAWPVAAVAQAGRSGNDRAVLRMEEGVGVTWAKGEDRVAV
eukprot:3796249-Pleurochrysis_carterae.AAC.2